jgi:hypothetical protein
VFLSAVELIAPPRARGRAPADEVGIPQTPDGRSGAGFYLALCAIALAIAAFSLLIPSTPSYDPWAWLVWGREIAHLNLHTTAGPSWKPLPVIFTTLFAPLGKAAPDLWLAVARAGAVMAVVMCFRVAWRLTRRLTGDDSGTLGLAPALLAGLIAAGSFVNSPNVFSENALGYSEGLLTALVLIALERHLDGARRQAFVIGFFACLDRPELWLLWMPYGVYLWRTDPACRALVLSLIALIPVLWFLPELWGSGHLLRAIARAQTPRSNSAAYATCPLCTEFTKHAWPSLLPRVEVAALLAIGAAGIGLWRTRARAGARAWREAGPAARLELFVLGVVGYAWWVGVAVETQAGFSGNDRYLVLGGALIAIAGGVGWAWGAHAIGKLLRRPRVAPLAGTLAAVAILLVLPPSIFRKGIVSIPETHGALIYQAHLREDLGKAVSELGGAARILRCGAVMTEGFQVPMVAYALGVHTSQVDAPPPSTASPGPAPNVIFQARADRNAFDLPVVTAWTHTHYTVVARTRTFTVYSSCLNKLAL